MGKINTKVLNLAFWIEVFLAYVLPFRVIDDFKYQVGFPIPFISVYDTAIGVNPLMSMSLNPIGLLFDGIVIYLIVSGCMGVYQKLRHRGGR